MVVRKSELKFAFGRVPHPSTELSNVAMVVATSAALILVLAVFVPAALVLPLFSLATVVVAVVCGLVAYCFRSGQAHESPVRSVAGAFMLLGCVAGMLSGPDQVLQLFGVTAATP